MKNDAWKEITSSVNALGVGWKRFEKNRITYAHLQS